MRHLNVAVTVPTSVDQDVTVITQPVVLSRTPAEVTAGAPQWGEHSEAILAELGYQPADLERLRAQGVLTGRCGRHRTQFNHHRATSPHTIPRGKR